MTSTSDPQAVRAVLNDVSATRLTLATLPLPFERVGVGA